MINHIASRILLATLALTVGASAKAEFISTNFSGLPIGSQPSVDGLNFGVANLGNEPAPFDNTPNLGQVAFFNNGSFYLGSNRAYGFAGQGRSDITFDFDLAAGQLVTDVTLQVRGSDASQSTGPSTSVDPVGPSTTFGVSDVTVLVWTEEGIELTVNGVSNSGFQEISLDISSLPFDDTITRISLINNATDPNSVAVIGSINATVVPEPASALAALAGFGLIGMRRRRA